jgi:hypothetical protein
MEDFVLKLIRTIIAVAFIGVVFGNGILSCTETTMTPSRLSTTGPGQPAPAPTQGATSDDPNDISAYYGFEDIEIVKLDWGIKNLRCVDFNGDDRIDIAVVNNRKAKIELLLQNEELGPEEETVAVSAEDVDINQISLLSRFRKHNVPISDKVLSFVCGDLNSDGMQDLAFYVELKRLYVMLQKQPQSDADRAKTLNWRTRKKIDIDDGLSSSHALVCADLNNDGADDLALAGRDAVYLIIQQQDASLAEPIKYPTTAQTLGIITGDLNGDTVNDLIMVTNDAEKPLHVRFGLTSGRLGPLVRFFIEKPRALRLYNVDGLAGDEVLTIDAVSNRLVCYRFAPETEQDSDWPISFYPLSLEKDSGKRDLAAGDFDGDGLIDIVISAPGAAELILYRQTAGLGLIEPVRFPAFADIAGLSARDVDGDGKAELAVVSVKEKVIGLSEFENDRLSFPKPIGFVDEPVAVELADIDNNGGVDCVYISRDANDARFLRVLFNSDQTAGGPEDLAEVLALWDQTDQNAPALELKKLSSNPDGMRVLDVDQDGLGDVLIFVKYDPPILVRQTSVGSFEVVDSAKAQASLIKDAAASSIAVADVDGKAGDELLLAQKNFARSLVFAEGKSWTIIDQYNANGTDNQISAVAAFDLDQRDSQEQPAILLLEGQKGKLQILKPADDKTYRFEKELDVGKWNAGAHLQMLFLPLTGGGDNNILLFDSEKFAIITPPGVDHIHRLLEQHFSYETLIKDGGYGNLVAGDINSDQRADIIMIEHKRNHVEILALNPQLEPLPAMRFKLFDQKTYRRGKGGSGKFGVEPREMKLADVTGDGKDDLVTIIHDRIIVYPQD